MAYPAGVQTVTLRLGSSFDSAGTLASISGHVVPMFGAGADHLVWGDTGQTYAKVRTNLAWDDTEKVALATVPHPTQAGWKDQTQATFSGWSYQISAVAAYASGERQSFERTITPQPGDTVIDVDLLPNGAAATPAVVAEWEATRTDALAALAEAEAILGGGGGGGVDGLVYSAALTDGTDQTATIQGEVDALMAVGGGTLVLPIGTITLDGTITLINDGATPPKQAALTLRGQGAHWSGRGTAPVGGTILDIKGTDTYGKLKTNGLGLLTVEGVTFRDTSGGTTPFIYTTNTTLHVIGCSFVGSKVGTNCDQDAIVCGGTLNVEGFAGWNDGFQGYGTRIVGNFFTGIRRGVYGRTFFNANTISDNTFWTTCGNPTGAAIEIDGDPTGTHGAYAVGNVISDNLIEVPSYVYAIHLGRAASNTVSGTKVFDAGGTCLAALMVDADALDNMYYEGFTDNSTAPLLDRSGNTRVYANTAGAATQLAGPIRVAGPLRVVANSGIGPWVYGPKGDVGAMFVHEGTNPYPRLFLMSAAATRVTDGVTVLDSTLITSATAAFTAADLGAPIAGTGIPSNALIAEIVSATQVNITQAATASASGVTLSFGRNGALQEQVRFERAHMVAVGDAPTVTTYVPSAGAGSSATLTGRDMVGTVTVTTGTGTAAGQFCYITPAIAWSATQHILVTPANAAAVAVGLWAERVSATLLRINVTGVPTESTAYKFSYMAIQAS